MINKIWFRAIKSGFPSQKTVFFRKVMVLRLLNFLSAKAHKPGSLTSSSPIFTSFVRQENFRSVTCLLIPIVDPVKLSMTEQRWSAWVRRMNGHANRFWSLSTPGNGYSLNKGDKQVNPSSNVCWESDLSILLKRIIAFMRSALTPTRKITFHSTRVSFNKISVLFVLDSLFFGLLPVDRAEKQ